LFGTWLLLAYLVASTGGNRGGSLGFGAGVAWWTYASTEFQVIVRYLALSVWPHPLVFEYDLPWALHAWDFVPYALGVAGLVIATGVGLVKRSILGIAGAWFFAILAPTSSIIPMQSIAEYRMYLPLAPVLCVVVAALHAGLGRITLHISLVLALVLGALTVQRNTVYQSELALWGDTVAKRPENARARCNFGIALVKAGRMADAVGQLTEALRLKPDFAEAHGSLGYALLQNGHASAALEHLAEAVRLKPHDAEAQNNFGNALLQLDRVSEAGEHFAQAVNLKPNFAEAHFNLGNVLLQSGRGEGAIGHYELALQLTPNDAEIHNNLGNAYYQAGRLDDAKAQFETTVRLRPGDAEGYNNLGLVLSQLQRPNEARAAYEQALRLRPTFPEALANLSALNQSK
jgi:Flp pilus assembly protein TadD